MKENLVRVETTYGELIERLAGGDVKLDTGIYFPEGVFVENGTASLVPVLGGIVKSPKEMIEVEFTNGVKMVVAEGHMFRYRGEAVAAIDATVVDTSFGDLTIKSKTPVGQRLAYDISVPAPHWYVNDDNCIYHHNTNACLAWVKAFLDAHPDSVCVFFDSEFGAEKYFDVFNIDRNRVIHIPFENLEELKQQCTKMIEEVKPEDKVIFFVDSVSQTASKKEMQDTLDGKAVADLTRAREMNSFFRIITPKINLRKIPFLVINSFYDDMDNQYADPIVKGGKQILLSSDSLFFVSRSQEKNEATKELLGWTFKYKVMKSRFVKEKAIIPITVLYKGGIDQTSALLEWSRSSGHVTMPTSGWYTRPSIPNDKKWQKKEMDEAFWAPILADASFQDWVHRNFSLETGAMFEEIDSDGVIEKA